MNFAGSFTSKITWDDQVQIIKNHLFLKRERREYETIGSMQTQKDEDMIWLCHVQRGV